MHESLWYHAAMSRLALAIAIASFLAALTSAAPDAAPQAPAPQEPPDAAAARETLSTVCGQCHEANVVEGPLRQPAEWDETISRMKSFGATASADQFAQVRVYLLWSFGRVSVNNAPAGDLAPVLDVASDVAEAVVKYRTDNGKFAGLDDLKKVPGIDAAKVDKRKARLVF